MKRTLDSLPPAALRDRRALVRVDFNVPLSEAGEVEDSTRIEATLPTLRRLLHDGSHPVVLSHLGRPKGKPDPRYSLAPVAPVLEGLLGAPVAFLGPADREEAVDASLALAGDQVLLLENTRFLEGETRNDPELARRFARLGDLFVSDAFGSTHRAHASVVGVAEFLHPAVAGLLLERELEALGRLRGRVDRPFVVVMGGAKISDKMEVIAYFLDRVDSLLIGGAMANTFLAAQGRQMGASLVEEEAVGIAENLLETNGDKIFLPNDLMVASDAHAEADACRTAAPGELASGEGAYDIGPETRASYAGRVHESATLFWNGPMGLFENPVFAAGTRAVAEAAAEATEGGSFTVVGGGDSARAIREAGFAEAVSHVSTGGGASLEYLATGRLPGIDALDEAPP